MKRIIFSVLLAASLSAEAQTQTYETEFARPLNEVLADIQKRFGIRLKYDIDTVGKVLPYADFRIRPYSVEESLTNVLAPFDYKFVRQKGNMYKLKAYEYPRPYGCRRREDARLSQHPLLRQAVFRAPCRFVEKRSAPASGSGYSAGAVREVGTGSFENQEIRRLYGAELCARKPCPDSTSAVLFTLPVRKAGMRLSFARTGISAAAVTGKTSSNAWGRWRVWEPCAWITTCSAGESLPCR